jgi:hypothetical protein
MNPLSREGFIDQRPYSAELKEKIKKAFYHPYSLHDVFPSNENGSAQWREIKNNFFY